VIQSIQSRARSHVLHGSTENSEIQHLPPNIDGTEWRLLGLCWAQTPERNGVLFGLSPSLTTAGGGRVGGDGPGAAPPDGGAHADACGPRRAMHRRGVRPTRHVRLGGRGQLATGPGGRWRMASGPHRAAGRAAVRGARPVASFHRRRVTRGFGHTRERLVGARPTAGGGPRAGC